ncbi:MAG: hypothetical protein AAFP97_13430, partial [Pseudomonadota bacterium]
CGDGGHDEVHTAEQQSERKSISDLRQKPAWLWKNWSIVRRAIRSAIKPKSIINATFFRRRSEMLFRSLCCSAV